MKKAIMREKTKKELKKWKETERVKKGNIRDLGI